VDVDASPSKMPMNSFDPSGGSLRQIEVRDPVATVGMKTWIVTIKLPKNWNGDHNPHNKLIGPCPFSLHCTDVTGEHHSFIVSADDWEGANYLTRTQMELKGFPAHITRIEQV